LRLDTLDFPPVRGRDTGTAFARRPSAGPPLSPKRAAPTAGAPRCGRHRL